MTREGEGAILEVKVSEREKEPFDPEEEEGRRNEAAHPPTHALLQGPGRPRGPHCPSFLASLSPSCLRTWKPFLQDCPTSLSQKHVPSLTFLFNLQVFLPLHLQTPFPCYLPKREEINKSSVVSVFALGPTWGAHLSPTMNSSSLYTFRACTVPHLVAICLSEAGCRLPTGPDASRGLA